MTLLQQNIFLSLFDSATKVTLYFIIDILVCGANAFLLLRSHSRTKAGRYNLRRMIIEGITVAGMFVFSFWAFVSSLVSATLAGMGLPLMWITYTTVNLVNLVCACMSSLDLGRRIYETIGIEKAPRGILRIERISSHFRVGAGICAIITGSWTALYILQYSLGMFVL